MSQRSEAGSFGWSSRSRASRSRQRDTRTWSHRPAGWHKCLRFYRLPERSGQSGTTAHSAPLKNREWEKWGFILSMTCFYLRDSSLVYDRLYVPQMGNMIDLAHNWETNDFLKWYSTVDKEYQRKCDSPVKLFLRSHSVCVTPSETPPLGMWLHSYSVAQTRCTLQWALKLTKDIHSTVCTLWERGLHMFTLQDLCFLMSILSL